MVGKKKIGTAKPILFYFAPPTFKFAHTAFSVLGGQKCIVARLDPNH